MTLNPGDPLLNGHYRILNQLGRGGFGFVYHAQDTLLGENVAIKELIPALVGDEAMLKRFLSEARATMRLTHKRIVRTHNVFSEGGNYYIVMEYMPGGSLEDRLQEQAALPVAEAVQVAAEVSEGLACAHEEGVVHCDLKPQNILFDAEGRAKLGDFGIAHVSGKMFTRSWHTSSGFVAGTLSYMSPEQTDGVRDDPRIDVYALGAVLYRMLTGRTYLEFAPQETPRSQAENVQRIFQEQPQPPSTFNRRVTPWLDSVVLKALAKRPEDRYANAAAMRTALSPKPAPLPLTATKSSSAQPAPAPTPGVRSVPVVRKRSPLPAWFWPVVGGIVVLLILLVFVVGVMLGGGGGTPTKVPQPTRTMAAVVTSTPSLTPTRTPTPTSTPPGIDIRVPTLTATNTRWPTSTSLPPTATDTRRPTATATPQPTLTLKPTAIPTRRVIQAGDTQTRSKDGMVMVYVPAGTFTMGSSDAEIDALLAECGDCQRDWFLNEQPQHTVYLDAFWLDKTEVTDGQYRECVEAGICEAPSTCRGGDPTYYDDSKADYPVACVDWNQARTYCEWAGARLPTEAEWEKAARGIDGQKYPWGNSSPDCSRAQYSSCDGDHTVPVGSKLAGASPYDALDMAGNVWEWIADRYDPDYYAASPEQNPLGPDTGSPGVLRGGAWNYPWWGVRAAQRGHTSETIRSTDFGFRCAVSP